MIIKYPKKCNLCGGKVIYVSNERIYGKKYGSGYCFLCTKCNAYVGTHIPQPKKALGLLADETMRKGKIMCHSIFDPLWKGKKRAHYKRLRLYKKLAKEMDIPIEYCHFGYFDIEQLRKAYRIIKSWEGIDPNELFKEYTKPVKEAKE